MYQVGTATRFRAEHVMPGVEGPEGELHEHDYRLEVVVTREALDDRGMVCDLDRLDAALREIEAKLGGKNLDVILADVPDGADAVTVEVFARWAHGFLCDVVRESGGDTLAVRVWESDDAFGGFSGPAV